MELDSKRWTTSIAKHTQSVLSRCFFSMQFPNVNYFRQQCPLPLFSKDGNGKRSSFDHFLAWLHFLLKPVVEDIGQSEFFLYRSRFEHLLEHHLHAFFRHVPVVGKRFYICVVGFRSRLLIKT